MVDVNLSGTLLVKCGNSSSQVIKQAKKHKMVEAFKTREKNTVDVIIIIHGTKYDILNLKNELLLVTGVKSIKSRITE